MLFNEYKYESNRTLRLRIRSWDSQSNENANLSLCLWGPALAPHPPEEKTRQNHDQAFLICWRTLHWRAEWRSWLSCAGGKWAAHCHNCLFQQMAWGWLDGLETSSSEQQDQPRDLQSMTRVTGGIGDTYLNTNEPTLIIHCLGLQH